MKIHSASVGSRIARIVLVLSLLYAANVAGQDTAVLPTGQGKGLVESQCGACHGLSTVVTKKGSREDWSETVGRMIDSYKADLSSDDESLIVDYLSTNFGLDAAHNPGQALVAEQCLRCHNDGMWLGLKTDREGWSSVVYRMLGRGGTWTPQQIEVMTNYLARTYGTGGDR